MWVWIQPQRPLVDRPTHSHSRWPLVKETQLIITTVRVSSNWASARAHKIISHFQSSKAKEIKALVLKMYKKTQEADFVEILKTVGKHVLIVLKADDNRKFNGIQKINYLPVDITSI